MWRGLACLAVVLYHESALLTLRFPALGAGLLYRANAQSGLGVQMFFVISGYCIAGAACSALRRGEGPQRFLYARVRRVYPPLWCSLALFALFSSLATALVAAGRLHASALADLGFLHQPLLYYLSNLTLTQIVFHQDFLSAVCWTLCYEMAFYGIVGLLLWKPSAARLPDAGEAPLLTRLHVLTLASLALLTAAPQLRFFPLDLWPQFGLGVIVFDVLKHPREIQPKVWLLAAGLGIAVFVASRSLVMSVQHEPSRPTFTFTLLFALTLLGLYRHDDALRRVPFVRALSAVGVFSYSLYLTHLLTLGIASQLFRLTPLTASAHLLILTVSVLGSVLAARLFFRICEQPFLSVRRIQEAALSQNRENVRD